MSERREGADPEAKPHALDLTCKARGSGWGFNVQNVRVEEGGRNGSMPERAQPVLTQPVVGKGKGGYTGSRPDRAQPLPTSHVHGGKARGCKMVHPHAQRRASECPGVSWKDAPGPALHDATTHAR